VAVTPLATPAALVLLQEMMRPRHLVIDVAVTALQTPTRYQLSLGACHHAPV